MLWFWKLEFYVENKDPAAQSLPLEQGQWLMMMGSAGEFPQTPEKGPVFVEDLPEEDQEHSALV